jgi:RHS repeat-associated protein
MTYPHGALRPAVIAVAIVAVAFAVSISLSAASASDHFGSKGHVRSKATGLRELPDMRTRTSRTFSKGRGALVTRTYAGPVNFRSGGRWRAIDNALEPSSKTGYALENAANAYTLGLPDSLGGQPVEIRRGEDYVRFALDGAKGAPAGGGVEARYENALPGVDVAYEARTEYVKESLVLASADAGNKFDFSLDLSNGLHARENAAGGIDFVRDGEVRMSFAPPFMHDSARPQSISRAVTLRLAGDKVVLRADEKWLRDEDRRYPVVIDPTTNLGDPADCYMVSGTQANTTFCGYAWNWLDIGKDGNGDQRRAFIQFDTSSIPKGAELREGDLHFYVEDGTQRNLDLHRVTHSSTSARTWNKYDGTNAWGTPGGDITSSPDGSNASVGGTAGWYTISARKMVQGWVDGSLNNYGLILKDSGAIANVMHLTGDQANQSYLEVEWNHRTGVQDRWTFADQQLSDRTTLKTNVANGNLIVQESDVHIPGINGHDLDFNRYLNNLELAANSSTDDLGKYWRSDSAWDVWLEPEAGGSTQAFNGPSDFWAPYDRKANGTDYTTPTGMNADLKKNADGTHTLTYRSSNDKINFNSAGDITSMKDRNSNTISYTYGGPNGRLTAIKDSHDQGTANNTLTFTYTAAGYIDKITDRSTPTVRTWDYNYTGNLLTSYINPDGKTTTYGYDANENLSDVTDPRGYVTHMTYDSQYRVTAVQRDYAHGGPITRFEYPTSLDSDCSGVGSGEGAVVGETIERDPLWPGTGNTHSTKYCWDKLLRVQKTVDGRGESRKTDYTANSDVSTVTSAAAQAWNMSYDPTDDRPKSAKAPAAPGENQLTQTYGYDDTNHGATSDPVHWLPSSLTDTQNKTTSYAYDSKGNMTAVKLPLTGQPTINVTPNANGTTQSITDANGNVTSYTYETDGDLSTIDRPSTLLTETMTYDVVHRMLTHAGARAPSITETYTYDPLDRMKNIAYTGGTSVSYVYDNNGNVSSRTDATGTSAYVYDGLNRLTQETLPGGRVNNYTYDNASNLATLQDAGGTTTYTYGASNLLSTMLAPGDTAATSFGYNKDAQRTTTTYPNGVVLTSDYEDDSPAGDKGPGRLKSVEAKKGTTVISKFTYGFKPNLTSCGGATSPDTALRHTVTNKDGVVSKYCYDEMERLIKADGHNGSNYSWTLDKNGNITKTVKGATTTSFGYDAANRLCWKVNGSELDADCTPAPTGATTYAHDTVGNLDTSSASLNLDYNSKGQTTSMTGLSGGTATAMGYAGPNQFERFTAGSTTFTNNALGVGAETTGTSTSYYRRDNEGALLSERLPSGAIYYYTFDGLGSVSALTDTAGTAQALYSYEPYGETTASGPAPTTANPWKYTSGYLDSTGFYKMGMRYYRPELMRWSQQDSLEQPTDPTQANRYGYAGGDPINRADPSGRRPSNYCPATGASITGRGQAEHCDYATLHYKRSSLSCHDVASAGGGAVGGLLGGLAAGPEASPLAAGAGRAVGSFIGHLAGGSAC